jgi:hypothetical protein
MKRNVWWSEVAGVDAPTGQFTVRRSRAFAIPITVFPSTDLRIHNQPTHAVLNNRVIMRM